ncbi:cysteine--tRNA ligase [Patescibacteria group bacterium]|nr:cysteine--tRNA ligase [Patescibacteria group bacterium]
MEIKLYNTLGREKEIFKPIHKGKAGIYSCGPTVYRQASIGNFRSFVFADTLRRTLEFCGYEVKHVMNITDVGHLTDDGSDGDDKMEKSSAESGKTAMEIAEMYISLFEKDASRLNIKVPTKMPRATEHIQEQIKLVEDIEKAGFAYKISDGIYFDTSRVADYGKLSGQKLEEKEEGARVEKNLEKKNATDFALWKFSYPNGRDFNSEVDSQQSRRQMEWPSPWGVGFPGWHIECSAMSEVYLDVPFDIHTGGEDHIPVHHTNEIAQTQAARNCPLADYWMHNAFLMVDGGKMSKSLGNTYTLDDLQEKGFDPIAFRYFLLGAHYRKQQNFTWEALGASQNALNKLRSVFNGWDEAGEVEKSVLDLFTVKITDDLDFPGALSVVWNMVNEPSIESSEKAATLLKMDEVLGLRLKDVEKEELSIPEKVQDLIDERKVARENHNWEESDRLRDDIAGFGFIVQDGPQGQTLRRSIL